MADPNGAVAFQLYLDPATLKLDAAQYEAIKHGTASDPDTSEGAQLADVVFVQQTVADGSGNTATALSTGSLGVSFLDDGPTILVTVADGSEGPTRLATLSLDESIGSDRGANGFPDGTLDDVSGNTSLDPTGTHPIGTMKPMSAMSKARAIWQLCSMSSRMVARTPRSRPTSAYSVRALGAKQRRAAASPPR